MKSLFVTAEVLFDDSFSPLRSVQPGYAMPFPSPSLGSVRGADLSDFRAYVSLGRPFSPVFSGLHQSSLHSDECFAESSVGRCLQDDPPRMSDQSMLLTDSGISIYKRRKEMESEKLELEHQIGGKLLVASIIQGKVLESNISSETLIHGSGGGGSISTNSLTGVTGRINKINISSSTKKTTKIWVKLNNNREEEWVFPGEISARAGHDVYLYRVCNKKNGKDFVYKFVNLTTGNVVEFMSQDEILDSFFLLNNVSAVPFIFLSLIIGVLSAVIFGRSDSQVGQISFAVTVVAVCVVGLLYKNKQDAIDKGTHQQLRVMDGKVLEMIEGKHSSYS